MRDVPELEAFAAGTSDRRRRARRNGRLESRAGGDAAHVRGGELPRAGHDAPRRDPRARGKGRPRRTRSSWSPRSRGRRSRPGVTSPTSGRRPAAAGSSSSRSPTQARSSRARRASKVSGPLGLAFRRSAGGTRRSPSSGWFRRPCWASTSRASWYGRGDGRGVPAHRRESRPGARRAPRPGVARGAGQGAGQSEPGGFGLWVEQLLAESTGKEGKGLVPVPGETSDAPDRQSEEVRVADPYELGAGVLPLGVRDGGRGLAHGHQPLRPAERPGGKGPDEGDSRTPARSLASARRHAR